LYVLTHSILYSTAVNACITFINIQTFCVFLTHVLYLFTQISLLCTFVSATWMHNISSASCYE
jgi:hypothetical protein